MRISKRVIGIGGSLGFIIDQPILKKLKLKRGDWVEIDIKPIKD